MKKFGILMVALIVAASVTVVMARPQGKGLDGVDGRGGKGAPYERLNLTEEQAAQVKALHESLNDEAAPIKEAMDAKRDELKELWAADTPDGDTIKAVQKEMDELKNLMFEKVTDNRLAVHEILTPEQREKMGDRGFGGKDRGGKKGGKRGGPPKGTEEGADATNI